MNRIPDTSVGRGAPGGQGSATRIVSEGRDPSAQHGLVSTPIYPGSTVLCPNAQDFL